MTRKFFTLAATAALSASLGWAQIQRTILVEEFTQASCPPCAAQNPAFNAFLDQNLAKTVSIKYQTSWPGYDPMNQQTQTWVGPRVTYYGVQGVPHMVGDGNFVSGSPSALTQAKVDTRINQTTPIEIELDHHLSADQDSIFITCTVKSYAALTGNFVAQIALVEREIKFTTPPGSNGEKEFFNVMRQMYPNASGTSLGTSLAQGFTQTITVAKPLPAYLYQKAEIGVVAFVQNNTGKEVLQAAWSGYTVVDAGVKDLVGLPTTVCDPSNLSVMTTIGNLQGNAKLLSCDVNWQFDNEPVQTTTWGGNLKPLLTELVPLTLPATMTPGVHKLKVYVSSPNGTTGFSTTDDSMEQQFVVMPERGDAPIMEDFSASTALPTNYNALDVQEDMITWTYDAASSSSTSAGSAKMPFYSSPAGFRDELYLPPLNVSALTGSSKLSFMVAHATVKISSSKYSSDTLQVQISRNCGDTWSTVWQKSGTALATAASTSQAFTPTSAQWRTENIVLDTFLTETNLMIRFVGLSNYGNNVYVDKINITGTTNAIQPEVSAAITLAPNPANTEARVLATAAISEVMLFDASGARVAANSQIAGSEATISLDGLANGLYLVRVTTANGTGVSRLTVMH